MRFRLAAVAWLLVLPASGWAADDAGQEFFEKQVRPILVARCHECHSGKLAKPKGNLRLDSREAALKGGDTAPAVVPGKPKESLLVDAINHGPLYQMPPKTKLPAEEIAVLTKWVELGAPWTQGTALTASGGTGTEFNLARRKAEHWCWQPIAQPIVPAIQNPKSKIQNPIDAFILARLEKQGLSPAPPTDKRTLIRRAYFDLIGLPPTPEEAEEFVGGKVSYEAVVDRLLDSPQFGERWARHWLDLVRYAESRGHEFDYNIPSAFEYRDYVIRALNADVPYDQFVIEQVAGDLLAKPRLHPTEGWNESIVGTGFWFLGEWVHSPVDIRKDECDRVDNQIDVFGKAFLGLTVACARCHDHKFDAISQRDYYALAGYLQSSCYRLTRFETWQSDRMTAADLAALDAKYRSQLSRFIVKAIQPQVDSLAKRLAAEADQLRGGELGVLGSDVAGAMVIVDYSNPATPWLADGLAFGTGPALPGQLVVTGDANRPLEAVVDGAARRDSDWGDVGIAAPDEGDPGRLSGWVRAGRAVKTPTWTLTTGQVHYLIEGAGHVYAAVDSHATINGPLHGELARDTGGNSDLPARWITQDLTRYVGQRVHLEFSPKVGEDFRVLKVVEGPRPPPPATRDNQLLGRGATVDSCRETIQETLELLAADKLAGDKHPRNRAALANWLIAQASSAEQSQKELADIVAAYTASREKLVATIRRDSRVCLAMWDGTPVDENVLIRGNHRTVGPAVPRRLLEALEVRGDREQGTGKRGQTSGSGRLELALRLVDPANPLTSRVTVNRVWQHLLGRGIVPSVDNFGVLGQPPTHPELLDYLAREFMQDGWSVKRLIHRIMLSSTYQQASGAGFQPAMSGAESADPQNLLVHRQNLRRLEGEAIRDSILAVSGRLDKTMFGPSVPVYLTPFMQGRGRPGTSGPVDGNGRRSLYVSIRRNFLSPMMLAFDTPIPFSTVGRRNVSNVPAQALILMNDPFVVDQSHVWARKLLADKDASPEGRIHRMYLAAFSREPTTAETAAALNFLDQQAREYGLAAEAAGSDERVWADLGHVIYNVKEFVLVE